MIYKTDKEAQAACVWWQKRLGLADWDVKVQLSRGSKMDDCQGYVDYVINRKQALIQLLVPEDYRDDNGWTQDHERTLIHELLHLHTVWWGNKADSDERRLEEQMIHLLAKAFVSMERGESDD